MYQTNLSGGLAYGRSPSEFDPVELRHGTKIELEHTSDKRVAREIAMDHLVEDPLYYRKLELMEHGALDKMIFPLGAYEENSAGTILWRLLSIASGAASAYHGYKRNEGGAHPLAWAIWWGIWGRIVPVITVPVALAQGFGKRAS